jgi:ankyrin repeat protein
MVRDLQCCCLISSHNFLSIIHLLVQGDTALASASKEGHVEIVKFLLTTEAKKDVRVSVRLFPDGFKPANDKCFGWAKFGGASLFLLHSGG